MVLDPAQPGTAETLALLGVTAIVIHPGGPADTPLQPREPTGAPGYRLVGRFPDTIVGLGGDGAAGARVGHAARRLRGAAPRRRQRRRLSRWSRPVAR